ncbi:MAG: DEAD/DEAH box helicase family protein [Planctomycetota bacterium]
MQYVFGPHEKNFEQWCLDRYPGLPDGGADFLRNLDSPNFKPPLWKHQAVAIKRSVYAFEQLNLEDLLLKIVTGGGKTVIIAAMIAYLRIVHKVNQCLILVPNTIVRARLEDAFDANPTNRDYTYRNFPFFFGTHEYLKDTISLHVMEPGAAAAGIRNANVILGNVHQIYERTDNWRVIYENCDRLAIFNDEAHNTKAENYNDLINKLKPKRLVRVDTTATPDRLDGLHPDSAMIYSYDIAEAMRDKVVKRVIVFKPDIEKVKFTYYDLETKKEISADEMPWEDIERKKIPAVRYVTNPKPMAQQLGIALECLKYQHKTVPLGEDGQPTYKPLMFVVALSIKDAEGIKATLEAEPFNLKTLLITNESEDEAREDAKSINKDLRNCKYDAIVSVMMLREGWDVKNISVIVLFRKFSYTMVGERIYSVYGPQIIGRGLRRISSNPDDWEQCHVVDHPVLKHHWLWDMIKAFEYPESLNPGDIIDERKIPEPRQEDAQDVERELEEAPVFDVSDLPDIPDPPEEREPISDWQKYLDEYAYDLRGMSIEQTIREIRSDNLDSGFNTLEKTPLLRVDVKDVNVLAQPDVETRRKMIAEQIRRLGQEALMAFDQSIDYRQEVIVRVVHMHLKKRFLLGNDLYSCNELRLLELLWQVFDQVRFNFRNAALIGGILANPPKESDDAEQTRYVEQSA